MRKAILLLLLAALPLAAQTSSIDCGPNFTGAEMPVVDQISSGKSGVLRGTIYTVSEQVRMSAGVPGSAPVCHAQWVRAYRANEPSTWNPPSSLISDMTPGPTLRARVGDMINLTFINAIDANKFPNDDQGCDATNVYPGTTGDKYPDCFADSVFTNMHFHGTHTSPNTTADNVFLNIRPSPRGPAKENVPIITAADVEDNFRNFYSDCNEEFRLAIGPKMWPRKWSDLKPDLQKQLLGFVQKYGVAPKPGVEGWYEADKRLIADGYWPQYFVGAYPYCFKLPKMPGTTVATTSSPAVRTPHTHGAGSSEIDEAANPERALIMGQAPGTHWYHAHKHGSTTINVMNGMTGVFVIEGDYDDALTAYYGTNFPQKVLVVQQLGSVPNLVTGANGDVNFFVNGKLKPVLKMPGKSVQMWRIANTSGRAGAFFTSPDALQWKQLAIDGVQLTPDNYQTRPTDFLLMSGNRMDLLVRAPAFRAGGNNRYDVSVYNTIDPSDRPPAKPTALRLTLFTVEVTPDGADMQLIPKDKLNPQPKFLSDILERDLTGTKVLTFATAKPKADQKAEVSHTIDGKLFDGELGAVVELNRSEEWKIVNASYGPKIAHPFHIHINPFQLTEIFDPNALLPVAGTRAGTVAVTEKKPDVTGTGTAFTKDFRAGDLITISGGQGGIVNTVTSDTSMTLKDNQTATVSGVTYSMSIPQYTIDKDTMRSGQCYLNPSVEKTWVPCGKPEPEIERVWWDVFPIPSGRIFKSPTATAEIPGYFKMRSRFVDYSGYFVLHCHILAHEDRGMMTVVEVAPIQTPYSHH